MALLKRQRKVLVIPDVHAPYHDERAFNLMIKAGKEYKPDIVMVLGDFVDFYAVSKYTKDPRRDRFLKQEIGTANRLLDEIDKAFPRARKFFLEGNHEVRLDTYIATKAPELFGLVSVKDLLKLDNRSYTRYVPYKKYHKIGKLLFTHGARSNVTICRTMLNKYKHSICFGHVHRLEEAVMGTATGESHVAFTPGWLGDVEKADYIRDVSDYTLGFATVDFLSTGEFFYRLCPIVNYKVLINGKVIRG